MVYKYKDVKRIDSEKGVNKPFEKSFMSGAYSKTFLERGTKILTFFKCFCFPQNQFEANLRAKNGSKGVRGHAPNGHFSAF